MDDVKPRGDQQESGRAAGFVGEYPPVGAVEAVTLEENEGPSCAPASGSVGWKASWRASKSAFRGEACSCGRERALVR